MITFFLLALASSENFSLLRIKNLSQNCNFVGICVLQDGMPVQNAYGSVPCGNGREGGVSPNAAAAAAVAAVAHGLRRQMCNMVVAAQRPPDHPPHLGLPPLPLQSPRLPSPMSAGLESPLCSPPPPGHALEPPKPADPFRPFASPRPDSRYSERDVVAEITEMGPPKTPVSIAKNGKDQLSTPVPVKMEPPLGETRAESIWSEAAGAAQAHAPAGVSPSPLPAYPYFVPNRNSIGYF